MFHYTGGTKQQQAESARRSCNFFILNSLFAIASKRHPHGGGYDPSYDTRSGSSSLSRHGLCYGTSYDSRYGLSYDANYDYSYDTGYGFRNGFSNSTRYGASFSPSSDSGSSSSCGASND
jgi:hypothetical protein